MRRYYRNFVFAALLVVMLVPGIAGTAGAELVRLPVDKTDSDQHDSRTPEKKKLGMMKSMLKQMSVISYVLPASLQAKLAPLTGPEMAALGASSLNSKQAIKVAQRMDPEFLIQCLHYFEPAQAAALLESAPNDLVINVAKLLIRDKEYALMASISDHMSLPRATSLFSQFNDADVILNVAYHMKNIKLMASIIANLPQEFVNQMIYDVTRLGATDPDAFKLMANLSQRLPVDRILQMMETVAPSDVATILIYYPPELILELMDRFDEYQLTMVMEKISSQMTPDEIGSLFRLSKPENKVLQQFAETVFNTMTADQIMQLMDVTGPGYLGAVALRCPPEMATKVLTKMDGEPTKKFAAKIGERLTPAEIAMLMEMAHPEYVAAVVPLCPWEVIDAVLAKADSDHLAKMALRFPPKLGIRTLKKMNGAQTRTLAAHIGRSWTAKQITLKGADVTYVAMILLNSPPEVVGAVRHKLNNAQLQGLIKIAAKKVESGDPRAMKIISQLVR